MAVSIILFFIIFCVVVISHELGHFIIAKKNGIHVVEFFIGMGPTLFSFMKGDTKYSLKLFPIGGACMFEGEDGLETEVNGRELTEILEEWMTNNCVAGRNHQKTASETSMYYDSARIPLFNENGKAVQAKQWLNGLRKYLKTLNVPSKVKTRGLGQAQLIIGE